MALSPHNSNLNEFLRGQTSLLSGQQKKFKLGKNSGFTTQTSRFNIESSLNNTSNGWKKSDRGSKSRSPPKRSDTELDRTLKRKNTKLTYKKNNLLTSFDGTMNRKSPELRTLGNFNSQRASRDKLSRNDIINIETSQKEVRFDSQNDD